jgi:hypothetical protein
MRPSVILWNLETVPDLGGCAATNDLVGEPDADVRKALHNRFPNHIYHTIVCIGALVAPITSGSCQKAVGRVVLNTSGQWKRRTGSEK